MNVFKILSRTGYVALFAALAPNVEFSRDHGPSVGYPVAEAQAAAQQQQQRRKLPGISEKVFKGLGKVAELASPPEESGAKPNYPEALKELRKLERRCEDCNPYEKSQIYNYFAIVSYQMDKINDAMKYYKKVLAASPNIPVGVELQTLLLMAQLSYSNDNYSDAINYINRWMKLSVNVTADIVQLRASIYYQKGDKNNALKDINRAVKMVEAEGKTAKESWLNLQRALYLEKEDYKTSGKILEKMIRIYPKKSYWVQLGSIYGLQGRGKDQLSVMDMSYIMGAYSKEPQIKAMAYLYLGDGVPYKAAKILEKGMNDKVVERSEKNLGLLATAWQQSKEFKRAIPVLEEAGKSADTGDYHAMLATLYLDLDDNKKAISASRSALRKKKVKKRGNVHFNLGVAYLNVKEYQKSIEQFEKAMKFTESARLAESWKKHASQELYRHNQLKSALEG